LRHVVGDSTLSAANRSTNESVDAPLGVVAAGKPQLRGSALGALQCAPLFGECGGPGRQTLRCCQGACTREGSGIMKCEAAMCTASYAECGAPGGNMPLPCCAPGFSCREVSGAGGVMKCMAAMCTASYAECGAPGGNMPLSCCEPGFSCSKVSGTAVTKCVPITKLLWSADALVASTMQCVPLSGECGGPGRQTLSCCQGTCTPEMRGGVMKCVAATCAAKYAECGGPGRQTLPCCTPGFACRKAEEVAWEAVRQCMPF